MTVLSADLPPSTIGFLTQDKEIWLQVIQHVGYDLGRPSSSYRPRMFGAYLPLLIRYCKVRFYLLRTFTPRQVHELFWLTGETIYKYVWLLLAFFSQDVLIFGLEFVLTCVNSILQTTEAKARYKVTVFCYLRLRFLSLPFVFIVRSFLYKLVRSDFFCFVLQKQRQQFSWSTVLVIKTKYENLWNKDIEIGPVWCHSNSS